MGTVSIASLGCLDIVIVAVIERGEQKPIADHLGRAKPAGHRGWLERRGNGVVLPLLALASCSGSRGG